MVGIKSWEQLAMLQLGGRATRLAQGRLVELVTHQPIPCQIDGEPAMLPPSTVRIEHGGQVKMLTGQKPKEGAKKAQGRAGPVPPPPAPAALETLAADLQEDLERVASGKSEDGAPKQVHAKPSAVRL